MGRSFGPLIGLKFVRKLMVEESLEIMSFKEMKIFGQLVCIDELDKAGK